MNPARLVYPGFWFGKTKIEDAQKWAEMGVGGFCLYGGTPKEIEDLSKDLKDRTPYSNILIAADYEDGLGRWVTGTELLPSNMAIGAAGEEDLAMKKGLITARQARSIGVDWVFAPVVDLACTPSNPIVNTRSFGCSPELVTKLSIAYMAGLSQGGVLNSLKHFPGHGSTSTDSHLAMPLISKSFDEIYDFDLLPYRNLMRFSDSIMVGHLLIPSIDDKEPSSLSQKTIKGLLRQRLNYKGCILTDALVMKAIGDQKTAIMKALEATVDILLAPEDPYQAIEILNSLPQDGKWKDQIINSIATQEMMIAKNVKAEVRTPEHSLFKSTYSMEAAPKCLTAIGGKKPFTAGQSVYYMAVDCKDFEDTPFAKQLTANGAKLQEYTGGNVDTLLIASYSGYASFKGYVNFTKEQTKDILAALEFAKDSVMVSFGSPFIHGEFIKKIPFHLLAYCANEDFQTVAADVLFDKAKAGGKLPVKF
ncbi:beta-glucosidase-like glycosyl hydrolase [Elusimicrobium simillimum]|uniref:glycoside hydrolase family 3 N-terminal domain-containing protein n=1 Tax=Elusimicrobium simillimum TaxID=3143438 RepID=UPI003C705957